MTMNSLTWRPGLTLFGEPVDQIVNDEQAFVSYRCAGCEVRIYRSDMLVGQSVSAIMAEAILDLQHKVSKARRDARKAKSNNKEGKMKIDFRYFEWGGPTDPVTSVRLYKFMAIHEDNMPVWVRWAMAKRSRSSYTRKYLRKINEMVCSEQEILDSRVDHPFEEDK